MKLTKVIALLLVLGLVLVACVQPTQQAENITSTTEVTITTEYTTTTTQPTTVVETTAFTIHTISPINTTSVVDIEPLLLQNPSMVWHYFGNEISQEWGMRLDFDFDSGLSVGVDGEMILAIRVGSGDGAHRFHFRGLSLASTYEEVVKYFGFTGGERDETTSPHGDAVFSYIYTLNDDGTWGGFSENHTLAARFFFNEARNVVEIHWFEPV